MSVENALRPGRLEFIREALPGVTPENPQWLRYSNSYQSLNYTPAATMSERRRVGAFDVQNFSGGAEDHNFELNYDMQQWFVDSNGDPLDAAYDGMMRNEFGEVFNTHSVLEMIFMGGRGTAGGGVRQYVYSTGCKMDTVTITGEPDTGDPINVTAAYIAEKMRVYRVDQPASATLLTVRSTSASDSSQTLTIESDDAEVSETVSLNGTSAVTTSATFGSLDAARLSAECQGDVTIEDAQGNILMTIYGRGSYQNREGDIGLPLLGSGDRAAPIVGQFESLLGAVIERDGDPLLNDVDIASATVTVGNNLDPQPSHKTIGRRINEGDRDVTIAATVYGPTASYDSINEHLRIVQADIVWVFAQGTLLFPGSCLTEPGSIARETSVATMTIDNTFTSKGIVIDPE